MLLMTHTHIDLHNKMLNPLMPTHRLGIYSHCINLALYSKYHDVHSTACTRCILHKGGLLSMQARTHTTNTTKSSLPKSMQPSIYPLGRRWTFSTSQVYTTQPASVMIALPQI